MVKLLPLPPMNELRRLFHYNPTTGEMRWKRRDDRAGQWNGRYAGADAGWVDRPSRRKGTTYRRVKLAPYGSFQVHRICFALQHGFDPGGAFIDHVNGNGLDNRAVNLRLASQSQKQQSQKARKTRGVYWVPRLKKYKVEICANGVRHYRGLFATEHEARQAFAEASRELHGSFSSYRVAASVVGMVTPALIVGFGRTSRRSG